MSATITTARAPARRAAPAAPAAPTATTGRPGRPISSIRRRRCWPPRRGSWCAAITNCARRGGTGLVPPARSLSGRAADCVDSTPPYRLSAGGLDLLVVRQRRRRRLLAPPDKVALYAGQLAPLLAQAPAGFMAADCITRSGRWRPPGATGGLSTNQTMQAAIRGLVPAGPRPRAVGSCPRFHQLRFRAGAAGAADRRHRRRHGCRTARQDRDRRRRTRRHDRARRHRRCERFGYLVLDRDPAGGTRKRPAALRGGRRSSSRAARPPAAAWDAISLHSARKPPSRLRTKA